MATYMGNNLVNISVGSVNNCRSWDITLANNLTTSGWTKVVDSDPWIKQHWSDDDLIITANHVEELTREQKGIVSMAARNSVSDNGEYGHDVRSLLSSTSLTTSSQAYSLKNKAGNSYLATDSSGNIFINPADSGSGNLLIKAGTWRITASIGGWRPIIEPTNIIDEVGYQNGKRISLSSTNADKVVTANGWRLAGLIPVQLGDVIRFRGFHYSGGSISANPFSVFALFDANNNYLTGDNELYLGQTHSGSFGKMVIDNYNRATWTYTPDTNSNVRFIRFAAGYVNEEPFVTKNEPLPVI